MLFVSSLFAISRSRLAQEKTDKRKDCLSLLWRASLQRLVDSASVGRPVLPDKRQGVIFFESFLWTWCQLSAGSSADKENECLITEALYFLSS